MKLSILRSTNIFIAPLFSSSTLLEASMSWILSLPVPISTISYYFSTLSFFILIYSIARSQISFSYTPPCAAAISFFYSLKSNHHGVYNTKYINLKFWLL